MSRHVLDLEVVLGALVGEHERLLRLFDSQQSAMRSLDLRSMETVQRDQEACRLRIAALETRRRSIALTMTRELGLGEMLTLARIAEMHPQRAADLLEARDRLKSAAGKVADRTHVVGRLATAVLGHLNTAVRLVAGAVEQAGVYTKNGTPRAPVRIGVMEAVG